MKVNVLMFNQDDPKKCTAAKLLRFGLVKKITKTPVVSTDVGVANEILSPQSIFDMSNFQDAKPDINFALESVKKHTIKNSFENFKKMFNSV